MQPEIFEHLAQVHDYAEAHGLAYAWEGTATFEQRKRQLAPEQYQLLAVHTHAGMTHVMLFAKDIPEVVDASQRDAARKFEK